MSAFVNNARRKLILFGKSCPFVLCFFVLLSDLENINAILSCDIIDCGGVLIYNTPISFAIGRLFEFDFLFLFLVLLVSVSIEACVFNKTSILYLLLILFRKEYFETHDAMTQEVYLTVLFVCSAISSFYIAKGIILQINKK